MINNNYYKEQIQDRLECCLDQAASELRAWEKASIKTKKNGQYPKNWSNKNNTVGFEIEKIHHLSECKIKVHFCTKSYGYNSVYMYSKDDPVAVVEQIEKHKQYLKDLIESILYQKTIADDTVDDVLNTFKSYIEDIKEKCGGNKTILYYELRDILRKM